MSTCLIFASHTERFTKTLAIDESALDAIDPGKADLPCHVLWLQRPAEYRRVLSWNSIGMLCWACSHAVGPCALLQPSKAQRCQG
jgi:hypothetical protein